MRRISTLLIVLTGCTSVNDVGSDGAHDTDVPSIDTEDTDTSNDDWADLGPHLEQMMTDAHIPGLAVAVTRPGNVLWTSAYGLANVDTSLAVTEDTPFMLASVSKTVTGVAVMHAIENHHLTLDTDINQILPFTVDNPKLDGETIQLRHLVTHTSGIRDNWSRMPYADGDSPYALGDYLKGYLVEGGNWYSATDNYYEDIPGTVWNYGNIATALAGYTIEATTTTPFDAYCDTHVFEALGMTNTGWHLADFDPAIVAMPTEFTGNSYQSYGHYGYADYPDGQLRSSINDIARFLAAITNGGTLGNAQVLDEATVDDLLSAPVPGVDEGQYVFWYRSTNNDRQVIGHNGGDRGVATEMVFSIDTGIGVVILMNTDWSTVGDAAAEIQALLFERAESL